tara:strand:- start:287 stop:568 length:282 start_codon:yes stop_codon:yes gene_type:complete
MQKVINVLAVSSAVVSLAVVGSVGYVFVNRTAIIEDIKDKAMEAVLGGANPLGGLGGGDELPLGSNDLVPSPSAPQSPDQAASLPSAQAPVKF